MKVPKARKLPSGAWFIQLRLGGESYPVTARTEKECTRQAELLKARHRAEGRLVVRCELTLRQAVDKYIDKRRNVLSPSTVRSYCIIRDNRFATVMDRPLKSNMDWQAVCNDEAVTCAAKTLKNAWGMIASVLREQGVSVPNVTLPLVMQKDKAFLDAEQIPVFIEAIKGADCEVPALLALHGLRRSEIWAEPEIDFRAGVIRVRGAVVPDESNKLVKKKENKNASSRRDVPIMIPELREAIEARRKKGKPLFDIMPGTAKYHIDKICEGAGLPSVGLHGLRHPYVKHGLKKYKKFFSVLAA